MIMVFDFLIYLLKVLPNIAASSNVLSMTSMVFLLNIGFFFFFFLLSGVEFIDLSDAISISAFGSLK